jgi:DNA-binding transcriptional LysR family regulator
MSAVQYRYKQNRFQQLRGFCHAATNRSVSSAARRMFLSQPSVSQQIQALESEMGVKLFERRKNGLELTPDGKLFYDMAMPLVEQLEGLGERFARCREDADQGRIDLAAGGSTILHVLPPPLEKFKQAHPGIELRLHNVPGIEGLAMIRARTVDFAVGPLLEIPDDIEFHAIASYQPLLITCRGHPLTTKKKITLKDISEYALVLPPRNLSSWALIDSTFRKHGLQYRIAMEMGGWELIKKYVEIGLGISIVMSLCITGDENLEVFPVDEFFPSKTYGVVLKKGRTLSLQARRLARVLLTGSEEVTAQTPASFRSGNAIARLHHGQC